MKSGGAVTVSVMAFVFAAAAPGVVAWIVMGELPTGELAVVLIVKVVVTGFPEVGFAVFDGAKLQDSPQPQARAAKRDRARERSRRCHIEVCARGNSPLCCAVTVAWDGSVSPTSTTCSVTGASCVMVLSVACALKV